MIVGDLIGVRSFPSVVQAADVRVLRETNENEAARDFIGGYLGFDERSRHALTTALGSLFGASSEPLRRGGAFFLNGVFGSGKSHMLGLLALLADGIGHEYFAATHPHFAGMLNTSASRFVTHFSLDDYDPAKLSLEAITQREIGREWQRRFGEKLDLPGSDSRREYFAALEEQLLLRGCSGTFLAIDELSLFLSAREHSALQADAAFLQFLGQRAARNSPCPLHILAAIQKNVDDIGDLETYSLSQIRDRFQTLPLSLAHLPSLVSHRLIAHKNPLALQQICRESYDEIARALPRLDFPPKEWETLFPFHPTTVTLLENVVARFFSRTRSAAIFCANAVQDLLGAPAESRVLPEAVFDYFLPDLELHPDLRPLAAIWQRWQSESEELAADANEAATVRRVMKTLLLFKIAGAAPTPVQLANATLLDARLPGDGNYEYTRVLLERILARGSHLAVERHADVLSGENLQFSDRYTVDLGTRVSELARRHLKNALAELRPDDARVASHVLSCCRDEPLPLSVLGEERMFPVFWRHSAREVAVQVLQSKPSPDAISNRLAMLREPGAREEVLLLIATPFSNLEWGGAIEIRNPQLLFWTPRPPTEDEWQTAREATAAHLLEDDPQLLDNRRGRAIVQFLKDASAPREAQIAHLARRLLREGTVRCGEGRVIEAAELAGDDSWQSTLESIADFALPQVFPKFESIAPRARVLTPGNADQLCLEILRRPADETYFAVSLERLVRSIAQPLGIAAADKGRWKIAGLRPDLSEELKASVNGGSTLSALEAHFSKSDWGLKSEQLSLALCALLRSGELTALDAKSELLTPAKIGMPLRRSVHLLRLGALLGNEHWARLQKVVGVLTGEKLGSLSFPEQEHARVLLLQKREEIQTEGELLQARLRQLQRALNHSSAQWPQAEAILQQVAGLLDKLRDEGDGNQFLQNSANEDASALSALLARWQELQEKLETYHIELLGIHRLLTHPRLSTPAALQNSRTQILHHLENGEEVLENAELMKNATTWRAEYAQLYREWHAAQHDAARWNSLRRLQNSDELRALERLGVLHSRSFGQAEAINAAIQTELEKHCPREGTLLPGEATCNACDLRFGERVIIRDAREIEAIAANAITVFQRAIEEETTRDYLIRDAANASLLQWEGNGAELLPLLKDEVLAALEAAFKPRRRVTRNLAELTTQLSNCRTRLEFEVAFRDWLDSNEQLAGDDEITLFVS